MTPYRQAHHQPHAHRVEVEGTRWDLALFVLGLAAILAVLALASPVPA